MLDNAVIIVVLVCKDFYPWMKRVDILYHFNQGLGGFEMFCFNTLNCFPVPLRNRLISGGLEQVVSYTAKLCIASQYIQFSTNKKKCTIIRIKTVFQPQDAEDTDYKELVLILGKLFIIRCNKQLLQYLNCKKAYFQFLYSEYAQFLFLQLYSIYIIHTNWENRIINTL